MGQIILVTGAARSGKSSFAEALAASSGKEITYFATAQADDAEMAERIRRHRASRPSSWPTIEEPLDVPARLADLLNCDRVVLLDCLTLWLSNLLLQQLDAQGELLPGFQQKIEQQVTKLVEIAQRGPATLICVSNEVGWSVVPENKLARVYRDLTGRANQAVARAAGKVYLVVAGYPLEIKASGSKIRAEIGVEP
ncbi:MAG TPA: bifunctional adenosylcobinamide kinase/adenosylcobinamide-phosphate guanylyltransferase [Desulfobacteria bacterium]|nr:bifunctional adenosylcobinamide kinase/adenosylcobinamide-phosphate guanylyltransferase [Desulfobacteria bacterium]